MDRTKIGGDFKEISDKAGINRKLLFFLISAFIVIAIVIVIFIFLKPGQASDFKDSDGDGIIDRDDPDANGDGIIDNFGGSGGSSGGGGGSPSINPSGDIDNDGIPNINDPDIDGDGIPNGNDPDVDGDGIPDNPPITPPNNDTIDNSTTLPITPPDNNTIIDNSTTPPENTTIDEGSCDNYRSSMNMDQYYFNIDFSSSECFALAVDSCNYGDAFLNSYFWNENLKCCVWKCTFLIE